MTRSSQRTLYVVAAVYLAALGVALGLWSTRNSFAPFMSVQWFVETTRHVWRIASADLLSGILAVELLGMIILGYIWWLGDIKKRQWPRWLRRMAAFRRLLAAAAFAIYVLVSPVAFLTVYTGLREDMGLRTGDRRQMQDPNYTGPERRTGSPRRTIERRAFAGHPTYHSVG